MKKQNPNCFTWNPQSPFIRNCQIPKFQLWKLKGGAAARADIIIDDTDSVGNMQIPEGYDSGG